jgi:general secretion pathway protein M
VTPSLNKNLLIPTCIAAVVAGCVALASLSLTGNRELGKLAAQYRELIALRDEYVQLKERIDAIEKKALLPTSKGVIQAVDDVFLSLGLKQKVRSVKMTSSRESDGLAEEEAELRAERVTINEMVNIFYSIEHAPVAMVPRRTNIKTSFENPAFLELTMTIALVRPK